MALSFGLKKKDTRDGIWKGDPALQNVPVEVVSLWEKDGQACHLEQFATNGKAEVFKFRALRIDETRGLIKQGMTVAQAWLECFRLGVRFPGAGETVNMGDGVSERIVSPDVTGFPKLALGFVEYLEENYPGIVDFYGGLIFAASFPSEPEKKASSPSSTAKPSSETATNGLAVTAVPLSAVEQAA